MKTWTRLVGIAAALCLGIAAPLSAAEPKSKSATPSAKSSAGAKIDVNTADAETLQTLPGIGPATARAIIAARPFSSVNDLEKVPGIGAAKLHDLRPLVRVSRTAAASKSEPKENAASRAPDRSPTKSASTTTRREPADTPSSSSPRRDATASTPGARIDVNTADAATLETLPGVGPATARAIIAGRPYASVDDLEKVSGIGAARLADLRDHVTVSTRSARTTTSPSRSSRPAATPPITDPAPRTATRIPEPEPTPRRTAEPVLTPTGRPTSANAPAAGTINLNTATLAELESLPEIGPVKAQAIIDARPFSSIEDVMRVKGIKEATFDAIKDRITVR